MTGSTAHDRPARIEGLDAWRAVLMLGGLFLHASGQLTRTPLFRGMEIVSEAFRMGCFFAISGYLSAIMLDRKGRRWIRPRLMQLGIPAMFGVTVLSPLIWLLIVSRTGGPTDDPPLPFAWHHLWFLFGLMGYSLAALAFDRLDRRYALIERLAAVYMTRAFRPATMLLAVAIASAVLFAVAPPAMRVTLPTAYLRAFATAQLIAGYTPMYFLGFTLARSDALRGAMLAAWRVPAAIVAMTALVYAAWFIGMGAFADAPFVDAGGAYVRFVGAAICPPAAFVLILRSALSMRAIPPFAHRLADASYTMYIIHVPLAIAIVTRLDGIAWSPYAKYMLSLAGSALGSYAFHRLFVRRSAALGLLFNGRASAVRIVPDMASHTA